MTQHILLSGDDTFFTTIVQLENTSGGVLSDLRYMISGDPDHDAINGQFGTINDAFNGESASGLAAVNATALLGAGNVLFATSSLPLDAGNGLTPGSITAVASVGSSLLNTNPFNSFVFDFPFDPDGTNSDTGINIVFQIASLGAGASVSFLWVTSVNEATDIDDFIVALTTQTTIDAGPGDDHVFASDPISTEILFGGSGDDFLQASVDTRSFDTSLAPAFGHDTLLGGDGNDRLHVDGGVVTMTGGSGADAFVFEDSRGLAEVSVNTPFVNSGLETSTIVDFVQGQDHVEIYGDLFGNLAAVVEGLSFSRIAAAFDGTNAGANSNHASGLPSFIYSKSDEILFYDDNGAATGYRAVAKVGDLSAADIVVTDFV